MFRCEVCGERFHNDQMSEEENVCKECYDEMELADLLALEIIQWHFYCNIFFKTSNVSTGEQITTQVPSVQPDER